jgi:hypothetical protein
MKNEQSQNEISALWYGNFEPLLEQTVLCNMCMNVVRCIFPVKSYGIFKVGSEIPI